MWQGSTDERDSLAWCFEGSVTSWLIVINVVVFLINAILSPASGHPLGPLGGIGAFTLGQGVLGFQVWRFISYQFLHAGVVHLFFNMLGLYWFGPLVERYWGRGLFVVYYLLCGVGGAWLFAMMSLLWPGLMQAGRLTPMVGASGSIFGVLVAVAMLAPDRTVLLLFPPIPMRMKTLAMLLLGIGVLTILLGGPNAGGQAAHLGGALAGYFLMRYPEWLREFAGDCRSGVAPHRVQVCRHVDYLWHDRKPSAPQMHERLEQILSKVHCMGIHSLTREERAFLHDYAARHLKLHWYDRLWM